MVQDNPECELSQFTFKADSDMEEGVVHSGSPMAFGNCHFHIVCTESSILSRRSLPALCLMCAPNEPAPGKAFCVEHYRLLGSQSPPIPTELRSFLKYCGIVKDNVQETPHECSSQDQEQIDSVLQATTADIGESSATSQGTAKLLHHYPQLLQDAEMLPDSICSKNTGEAKRLRRWSRGHQFVVRAGGHIESWQPLYKSEGAIQVFFILITWLLAHLDQIPLSPDNLMH